MTALTVKEIKELLDGGDLDLSTKQLEDIPVKQLKEVPRAISIDLSNNQIFTIPPEFCTYMQRLAKYPTKTFRHTGPYCPLGSEP